MCAAEGVSRTPCCRGVVACSSLLPKHILNMSVETMDIDSLSTKKSQSSNLPATLSNKIMAPPWILESSPD